jgi:hypothetical protein
MEPAKINNHTHRFEKPEGWDRVHPEVDCGTLYVRRISETEFESAFRPTEEELKLLQLGGVVVLRCFGGQPPVALYVEGTADDQKSN